MEGVLRAAKSAQGLVPGEGIGGLHTGGARFTHLALQDFSVILGLYMSALHRRVIGLPVEPEPALIEKLRRIEEGSG